MSTGQMSRGRTAPIMASQKGHVDVVRTLLESGNFENKPGKLDANKADVGGATAPYLARQSNHADIVRVLLESGEVEVNEAEKDGTARDPWPRAHGPWPT